MDICLLVVCLPASWGIADWVYCLKYLLDPGSHRCLLPGLDTSIVVLAAWECCAIQRYHLNCHMLQT